MRRIVLRSGVAVAHPSLRSEDRSASLKRDADSSLARLDNWQCTDRKDGRAIDAQEGCGLRAGDDNNWQTDGAMFWRFHGQTETRAVVDHGPCTLHQESFCCYFINSKYFHDEERYREEANWISELKPPQNFVYLVFLDERSQCWDIPNSYVWFTWGINGGGLFITWNMGI